MIQGTCTLTIVRAGISDHKIKISPAEHVKEKVWLDTRIGKERMEELDRIIQQCAPRTGVIPKPVPMCGEKLNVIDLLEENIPHIHLEGHVLKKPVETDEPERDTDLQMKDKDTDKRLSSLEANMTATTTTLGTILEAVTALSKPKATRTGGRKATK